MSKESDKKFFTNFTYLIIGITILMIVLFFLGGKYGGGNTKTPLNLKEAPTEVASTPAEPSAPALTETTTPASEPEPVAAVEETVADAVTETTEAEVATAAVTADAGNIDAEALYNKVCVACHAGAIPGIPKLGEKADWEPRIAQGMDVLYDHAINGYMGTTMMMPPRGGGSLSDDEVKAVVDYMVESSQ